MPLDCGLLTGVVRGARPMSRAKARVLRAGVAAAVSGGSCAHAIGRAALKTGKAAAVLAAVTLFAPE